MISLLQISCWVYLCKSSEKAVKILQSYGQEFGVSFLTQSITAAERERASM